MVGGKSGEDVHEGLCPLGAINIMKLLEHNLHLLPVGGAHGDKVKTLYDNLFQCKFLPGRVAQLNAP